MASTPNCANSSVMSCESLKTVGFSTNPIPRSWSQHKVWKPSFLKNFLNCEKKLLLREQIQHPIKARKKIHCVQNVYKANKKNPNTRNAWLSLVKTTKKIIKFLVWLKFLLLSLLIIISKKRKNKQNNRKSTF